MFNILVKISLNKLLAIAGVLSLILVIVFWFWWGDKEINITNWQTNHEIKDDLPKSPISGIICENAARRPISIMMAADPETRPLSGINEADMVFEMPVTPNGITRFMAVFQCNEPAEIGSIRSARNDFIPLAYGLGSVYAHWGGEKETLEKLENHIMDNINAMKYEGTVFYRKKGVPMPHNGFTDIGKIIDQAGKLGYSLENTFSGYLHEAKELKKNLSNLADEINIEYPRPYDVRWDYDEQKDEYRRYRGRQPEMDRNTNEQVSARVIAVIKTTSKYLSKDYISVATEGNGEAVIYQGGVSFSARWQKDPSAPDSKLYFYDNEGDEIKFLPGKIWVEVVTN